MHRTSLGLTPGDSWQDFPELGVIRGLLGHKFGREYISEASDDTVCRKWQVNENLRRCRPSLPQTILYHLPSRVCFDVRVWAFAD